MTELTGYLLSKEIPWSHRPKVVLASTSWKREAFMRQLEQSGVIHLVGCVPGGPEVGKNRMVPLIKIQHAKKLIPNPDEVILISADIEIAGGKGEESYGKQQSLDEVRQLLAGFGRRGGYEMRVRSSVSDCGTDLLHSQNLSIGLDTDRMQALTESHYYEYLKTAGRLLHNDSPSGERVVMEAAAGTLLEPLISLRAVRSIGGVNLGQADYQTALKAVSTALFCGHVSLAPKTLECLHDSALDSMINYKTEFAAQLIFEGGYYWE